LCILVLSFYYQPDLCAGSFRATSLIEQLKQHDNVEIEIVTTMPNRYASFSASANRFEQVENVTINRIELPSHKSGMLDQIKSFTRFYIEAIKLTKNKDYDLVFATSSRLFTAFLGARLAKKKRLPLYLDIRDIFVDTIKDVLSPKIALFAKPVFSFIEKYTFKRAQRINLVSRGFEQYFERRYPETDYRWYTNGIDKEFLEIKAIKKAKSKQSKILQVIYAGNLGEGQGLHNILPQLAKMLEGRVEFNIIGDGGRKALLESALALNNVTNVKLLPPVNRDELIICYQKADILFLHLNDYSAFKKVLPSKIFEYSAMGKPILAGVSGYAAEFLNAEVENSAVFEPGDYQQAVQLLDSLDMTLTKRDDFITKYSRVNIMSQMAKDLVDFASNRIKL
jgi:glycosyltransferase involved in cell wall biosynthesis